jgi:hypothetical protein
MRLVIVSQVHPATPHVSAMRAWYFARELASYGHHVVQICESRAPAEFAPEPEHVAELLCCHQWTAPLLMGIRPVPRAVLDRIRAPETRISIRKALVVWNCWRHSGMFTDFSDGVQPYLPVLANEFRPHAVWGVFGNTDCWLIAQRLARLADCPWIGDMKDSWEVFMRRGLRGIMARRFRDMAASTANAEFNARVMDRWFSGNPAVVYSGVDSCFVEGPPAPQDPSVFRITLTGSVRDIRSLHAFVEALIGWLLAQPVGERVPTEVVYAGGDVEKVQPALKRLEGLAQVVVHHYLPLPALAALCRSASINAYIWAPTGFHHKLLELLSCGRPVIAFPGETEESRRLSTATSGMLEVCHGSGDLHDVLDAVRAGRLVVDKRQTSAGMFSWSAQARALEDVLASVCRTELVA